MLIFKIFCAMCIQRFRRGRGHATLNFIEIILCQQVVANSKCESRLLNHGFQLFFTHVSLQGKRGFDNRQSPLINSSEINAVVILLARGFPLFFTARRRRNVCRRRHRLNRIVMCLLLGAQCRVQRSELAALRHRHKVIDIFVNLLGRYANKV